MTAPNDARLPWRISFTNESASLYDADNRLMGSIVSDRIHYVLRAVNSHHALVEAAKEGIDHVHYYPVFWLTDPFGNQARGDERLVNKCKTALTLAGDQHEPG